MDYSGSYVAPKVATKIHVPLTCSHYIPSTSGNTVVQTFLKNPAAALKNARDRKTSRVVVHMGMSSQRFLSDAFPSLDHAQQVGQDRHGVFFSDSLKSGWTSIDIL